MFYLKYRPQTIEEIDNKEARQKLSAFLSSDSLGHAFLFSGPKGTGKTSSARIVAKSINCTNKKKDSIEPCNKCENCIAITKGNSVDVIEMDAASNRKIDDIRELISQVIYSPITSKYKVYIIDEVHMLTKEAFNALLKTLEEPPSTVIFILATTEPEKLLTTIRSRCLSVEFTKAKKDDILRMLNRITTGEKITISDEVLNETVIHSDNSFRDASKLLEEFVNTYVSDQDRKSVENLRKVVGLRKDIHEFLGYIEGKKTKQALEYLTDFDEHGGNARTLIESCMAIFHGLILYKHKLIKSVHKEYSFSIKEISLLIKLFTEAYNTMKYSPIEILPLEIAVIEYCETI